MNQAIIIKILLVEDDIDCLEAIENVLRTKGYNVSKAVNGLEAVDMCFHEKFDLILMDYQMPLMDGLKATQIIRKTNKNIPIISISSRNDLAYINECNSSGVNTHIPKGHICEVIRNKELESIVEKLKISQ